MKTLRKKITCFLLKLVARGGQAEGSWGKAPLLLSLCQSILLLWEGESETPGALPPSQVRAGQPDKWNESKAWLFPAVTGFLFKNSVAGFWMEGRTGRRKCCSETGWDRSQRALLGKKFHSNSWGILREESSRPSGNGKHTGRGRELRMQQTGIIERFQTHKQG